MSKRKKPNLYRLPRAPNTRYTFSFTTTKNYMYCTVHRPTGMRGPTIYHIDNIPKWVKEGMQLIDLAVDPTTGEADIPGFGGKQRETNALDKYIFYAEDNTGTN